jgi:outer membrane protein assembly factor BamB
MRSGVLVDSGVVYTTAGMWPSEGVFVYALDAITGEQIWCNDTSGRRWATVPHQAKSFSGVAPQGYLLAGKSVLLVPTGRSVPAGFNRKTGELLYYNPQGEDYGTQYYGCSTSATLAVDGNAC